MGALEPKNNNNTQSTLYFVMEWIRRHDMSVGQRKIRRSLIKWVEPILTQGNWSLFSYARLIYTNWTVEKSIFFEITDSNE